MTSTTPVTLETRVQDYLTKLVVLPTYEIDPEYTNMLNLVIDVEHKDLCSEMIQVIFVSKQNMYRVNHLSHDDHEVIKEALVNASDLSDEVIKYLKTINRLKDLRLLKLQHGPKIVCSETIDPEANE